MYKRFLKTITHPSKIITFLDKKGIIRLPDELYLKILYKNILGRKLDLENPQTFNEKLQWLKLNDRKDIYTTMVDKYAAKEYVSKIIGEKYIIPTLGVYDKFDDIDFDKLPNQFVIKCTHDSGGLVIVKDKNMLDIKKAKSKIEKSLKTNYYIVGREWPYKNVERKIIIEEYMGDDLYDYKFQCFNGNVDNILACEGRQTKAGVRYYYFDVNWKFLNYCPYDDVNPETFTLPKIPNLDEMILLAKKISANYPEMRVDFYNINGKIYFGEITLYSCSGFDTDITYEADVEIGSRLILPYDLKGEKNEN